MINKQNLLRMADHIEKVPQEMFDMENFRIGQQVAPECDSVGCIIGHSVILAPELITRLYGGKIDFYAWCLSFTGLSLGVPRWKYLFGSAWKYSDDTPIGAAKRIRYFVENGLPKDWEKQMYGNAKLSYL